MWHLSFVGLPKEVPMPAIPAMILTEKSTPLKGQVGDSPNNWLVVEEKWDI